MVRKSELTRRSLVAKSVAAGTALLAGCSGSSGSSAETTETTKATSTTETTTTAKAPTVENFSYPAGASQSGVSPQQLYNTHRSAVVDAGSATVSINQETDREEFSSSKVKTNSYSSEGLMRVTESSGMTSTLWSPSSEPLSFVQMDTGFNQRYRIENQAPSPERHLKLPLVEQLLDGAQWSEATKVVETESGEFGVTYEATGIASQQKLIRIVYGQQITDFTASITVTESGYLSDISYAITASRESETTHQKASLTVGSLGETTVEEPSWADTARKKGVQFKSRITDDRKAVELELVNGTVPSGTRVHLSGDQFASTQLEQKLTVGNRLYLGFSDSGNILVEVGEVPTGATKLPDNVFVALNDGRFELFNQNLHL